MQKKIKYAKWNAARILKAIREGVDPNESNPKPEESEADTELPSLDPNDPDVRVLDGAGAASRTVTAKAATVEDDPDSEFYRRQAAISASASVPTPPAKSPTEADRSAPGPSPGYFPTTQPFAPSPVSQTAAGDINLPSVPSAPSPDSTSHSFGSQLPPPTGPPPPPQPLAPSQPQVPQQAPAPPPAVQRAPVTVPAAAPPPDVEGDIPGATKHARFAISALNFEDVPTAIKELRAALAALGAQP